MTHSEIDAEKHGYRELDLLLAAIQNGEIETLEDLDPDEIALLMTHARDGEELEDLFDRIAPPDPGRI